MSTADTDTLTIAPVLALSGLGLLAAALFAYLALVIA
jgi:hypothetical protein